MKTPQKIFFKKLKKMSRKTKFKIIQTTIAN